MSWYQLGTWHLGLCIYKHAARSRHELHSVEAETGSQESSGSSLARPSPGQVQVQGPDMRTRLSHEGYKSTEGLEK